MRRVPLNSCVACVAAWLVLCLSACSGSDGPTKSDCTELRAHVVDLQLASAVRGDVSERDQEELAKHRRARMTRTTDEHLQPCLAMSEEQLDCRLEAATLADFRRCQETSR